MPADAPQGRIGYVMDGFGEGKTAEGMKESFCLGCKTWFDARQHGCPGCGWEKPGFNKDIRTKQLNRQLYEQAARVR